MNSYGDSELIRRSLFNTAGSFGKSGNLLEIWGRFSYYALAPNSQRVVNLLRVVFLVQPGPLGKGLPWQTAHFWAEGQIEDSAIPEE